MVQSSTDEAFSQIGNSGGDRLCPRTRSALVRYCDDGFIEIDNAVALGRKTICLPVPTLAAKAPLQSTA
jgi:hypothetical protein